MAINVGDTVAVTLRGSLLTSQIMSTFWYRCTVGMPGLTLQADYDSIILELRAAGVGAGDWIETAYLQSLPSNYTLDYLRVQVIAPVRNAYAESLINSPGAVAHVNSVSNLAGVITKRTIFAGRKFVGSLHLPISQSFHSGGEVSGAGLTAMAAIRGKVQAILSIPGGGSFLPIIYHRVGAPNYTDISSAETQETVRVMRRRTLRIGI